MFVVFSMCIMGHRSDLRMFVLLLMSLWFSVKNQESLLQSMLFVVSTCLSSVAATTGSVIHARKSGAHPKGCGVRM